MADAAGTIEHIAIELARTVGVTTGRMRGVRLATTLADLGIGVAPIPAGVVTAASTAAGAADAIAQATQDLVTAIDASDEAAIVLKSAALVTAIGQVISGFAQIASALQTAGVAVPADFATRVLDLFIVDQIDRAPGVGATLTVLGLIERIPHVGTAVNPNQTWDEIHIHWDRIFPLLSNPGQHFQDVYQWGAPAFDGTALFAALYEFLGLLGLPARLVPASGSSPARLEAFAFDLTVDHTTSPPGLALAVVLPIGASVSLVIPLPRPGWNATVDLSGAITTGTTGRLTPPLAISFTPPSATIAATAKIGLKAAPSEPILIFGQAGKSRIEVASLAADVGVELAWDSATGRASGEPLIDGDLRGGKLVIDTSESDGFLASLLSGVHIESDFDFGFAWSGNHGISFHGSASLQLAIPVDLTLGPITIPTIYLVVGFDGGKIPIELSAAIEGQIGPVSASVDRMGVLATLAFPPGGGNLGPAQLDIDFKPPSGLGIAIDAGPISGGGFIYFDPPNGRYAGVLALSLYSIQVKAIGLLDTKLPGGASGYSFLIIISVEFTPIQLGFGFTLNGVGGLCGINRDFVSEALQAGLRAHSLDHILFPKDPVKNAPAIISDLRTIFPPAEGRYVFGPMLELGWGGGLNLVTAELGILLALPSPIVIAILGQLNVNLPSPDAAIVELHLDVLGIIDFGKKLFSLDATLHDSRVVVFTIYGDMAMRLSWGDDPSFALSIGGLNPHFQPPDNFPQLRRLTIALSASDALRLSIQSYFAITSNSFQFGAKAELYAGVSAFNVYGWLGFDALFVFKPFSFIVDFTAGLALRSGDTTLFGISVDGSLSGATPWHVDGNAHISILFFEISVHVSVTWGDSRQVEAPPVDAWPPLQAAIQNLQNWSGSLPSGIPSPVTLATPKPDPAQIYVDPNGVLTLRERVLPLNQTLTKFGEAVPGPQTAFSLDDVQLGGQSVGFSLVTDKFAPAQFEQMSDQDKLSRPSFDDGIAGFSVGAGQLAFGQQFGLDLQYADIYVDDLHAPRIKTVFRPRVLQQIAWAGGNAAAASALRTAAMGKYAPPAAAAPLVTLGAEQFVVASTTDLAQRGDITPPVSKGAAYRALAGHLANNPNESGQLQVVPLHELAA
jgi:hypothetical protein